MTANGRWCRCYITGPPGDRFYLTVTYHRRIGGRTRQLKVSPKLMRRVLRARD